MKFFFSNFLKMTLQSALAFLLFATFPILLKGQTGTTIGPIGNSHQFNGADDFISSITTSTDPAKAFPTGNAARTIEALVMVEDAGISTIYPYHIFSYGNNNVSGGVFGLMVGKTDGKISFWGHNRDVSSNKTIEIGTNKWFHLAITWDGTNMKFYINGVFVYQKVITGGLQTTGGSMFFMGNKTCSPTSYKFKGKIDEVRVWNTVKDETAIISNYQRALTPGSLPNDLVAYFNFESGTDNIVTAGSTPSSEPTTGISLHFDRHANPDDDYLSVPATGFPTGNAARTIEARVMVEDAGTTTIYPYHVFSYGDPNVSGGVFGLLLGKTDGKISFWGNNRDVSSNKTIEIASNKWFHLAITWDGTNMKFYINGDSVYQKAIIGGLLTTGGSTFNMGNINQGKASNLFKFKGKMDEVRVWDKVRSNTEIQKNYSKSLETADRAGLVAYFDFENGTGQQMINPNHNNTGVTVVQNKVAGGPNGTLAPQFGLDGTTSNFISDGGKCASCLLTVTLADGSILYVHPSDQKTKDATGRIRWGKTDLNILNLKNLSSIDAAADFDGKGNTKKIVTYFNTQDPSTLTKDIGETDMTDVLTNYAAKLCYDLVDFGYSDWYLPSAGELNVIYKQLGPIKNNGFNGDIYYSSTIESEKRAHVLCFGNCGDPQYSPGSIINVNKWHAESCRCVRKN